MTAGISNFCTMMLQAMIYVRRRISDAMHYFRPIPNIEISKMRRLTFSESKILTCTGRLLRLSCTRSTPGKNYSTVPVLHGIPFPPRNGLLLLKKCCSHTKSESQVCPPSPITSRARTHRVTRGLVIPVPFLHNLAIPVPVPKPYFVIH